MKLVGVGRRGFDALVAQKLLHVAQVRPVLQQVRGQGMADGVGREAGVVKARTAQPTPKYRRGAAGAWVPAAFSPASFPI